MSEPILIWVDWAPWLWKSHLCKALFQELQKLWLNVISNITDPYILSNWTFRESNIIILDDLFQSTQDLNNIWNSWHDWMMMNNYLIKILFDVYENNKVLVVTSNFKILDILEKVSEHEKENKRLVSRIKHLLSHTHPITLTWTDYREILANKWWKYSWKFANALAKVLTE